ncbi:MAG TPA: serine/threonine-protein kinase [Kofleriaceae bacterium]|nr:serine/threonine-protein kinase [Kofleriaceae bacterium]
MGDFPIGFGRYQLVERLAVGGMAELYVAAAPGEHGFQKKVVIKRLLPHLIADETYNAMFIDEAKLTARLVHPKIAQTFELGKVDDALFIAMEYVDGIDVLALLREFAVRRRRVEPQLAAWIAHEVLDALDYAHNLVGEDGARLNIVHRDISPSNVLLSVRGDIKLVDFGIARQQDPERAHKSKSGTLKGKYGYMSPEQVIEHSLDARSDVFSVGVVLAELLTGRRLFAAANELDVLLMVRDAKLVRFDKYGGDVEADLADIARRALRKSVDERWQSAAVFRDALAEWLFEHRHRMTSRNVADVVTELRDAVVERRQKTVNAGTTVLDEVAASPAAGPAGSARPASSASRDAAPVAPVEREPSMPMISVSYEPSHGPDPSGARPVSVGDLASRVAHPRAETVQARPSRPPLTAPPPTPGGLPVTRPTAPPRPRPAHTPRLREATEGGVVDVPIADTISAAVEAITLPIPERQGEADERAGAPGSPPEALGRDAGDDSAMRAFEDLEADALPRTSTLSTDEDLTRRRSPTPPALAEIADPPDDSGEFGTTSPLRVLFRLMTARATGLLLVAVGGIKKEIYVRDGQPEYVSSNVASELFGNYLVSKNVLSDGELAMALAMMPHYGGKLGDTLVGLGLLKPLEVFRHLTRQVRTKIIDVCTWNKGAFGWYAGRENPREAFPLDFNAFEILGAGAMAISEDFVESWIARNAGLRLRAARTRRIGPERFEVKGLAALCEALDGKRPVTDLVEASGERGERLNVGRMLILLEACDLARPS